MAFSSFQHPYQERWLFVSLLSAPQVLQLMGSSQEDNKEERRPSQGCLKLLSSQAGHPWAGASSRSAAAGPRTAQSCTRGAARACAAARRATRRAARAWAPASHRVWSPTAASLSWSIATQVVHRSSQPHVSDDRCYITTSEWAAKTRLEGHFSEERMRSDLAGDLGLHSALCRLCNMVTAMSPHIAQLRTVLQTASLLMIAKPSQSGLSPLRHTVGSAAAGHVSR